jgi:hypothetical protein
MINLLLTMTLMGLKPATQTAQVQPCVWPRTCNVAPVVQVQPCVWPRTCIQPVAQVQTCQWPKPCVVKG